jgi:hypothetical protein
MEAVEKSRDSGVHRWGESSNGRWRWRHGPAVSVRKREGEGDLNWGQRWLMGGSHREATEVVALGWKPKRRRSLWWWQEPAGRTHRRWRRGRGARARVRSRGERRKEGASGGRWLFKRLGGVGHRGEKGGGPAGAAAWQREKEERGPWAWRSAAQGGQQRPPAVAQ